MIQKWIDFSTEAAAIFSLFRGDYTKGLHGSLIAQKIPISQPTVSRKLEELEKSGFLNYKMEGKNKVYYPNLDNPNTQTRLELGEIHHKVNFLRRNPQIQVIWDTLKKNEAVKGTVIMFGSYAKGQAKKDSDIDLLVVGDVDKKKIREIEQEYDKKINIQRVSSIEDIDDALQKGEPLIKEILDNHVVLSGAEAFVELLWRYFHGIRR